MRQQKAFSLVEVTLALGIASFGFITLLALIPQGLQMARRTADTTVRAQIVRAISNELYALPWQQFPAPGYGPYRYYDIQGVEIAAADSSILYVASVFIPANAEDVALPNDGNASAGAEPNLRRVKIFIGETATSNCSFDGSKRPHLVGFTSVLLSRLNE